MPEEIERIVKWDITNRCNTTCPYCLTVAQRRGAADLSFKEIMRCIDVLAYFAKKISLLGGEPTCLHGFPEVIKYAKQKGLSIEVVTNALRIDSLTPVLNLVDRIVISIDGPDANTYGILRDPRFFERVLNNARFLARCVPVDINCIVHKRNFNTLHQMLELAIDVGAKSLNLLQFVPPAEVPTAKDLVLTPREEVEALVSLGEAIQRVPQAESLAINARFSYPLVVWYVNKIYGFNIPLPEHMCGAGITFAYVNQRGELFPCDRIAQFWQKSVKSSVLTYELSEIITNELFYDALVFQVSSDTYRQWLPCYECPFLRKLCFPCPVGKNEIIMRNIVETCFLMESTVQIEVVPHVLFYATPDRVRGIVFNPLHGPPVELNKTALEIYELIRANGKLKQIVREIAKRYNKNLLEVYEDVTQIIERLCQHGIVRYRRASLGEASGS